MLLNYLLIFFVSMLPVAELRVAVPMAVALGLPQLPSIAVCTLGNMVPVPFIYLFARKILTWGKDKRYLRRICQALLTKGEKAGQKLVAKTGRFGLFVALMLFVGVPLPGTGAWTGAMAASFLNMGIKSTAGAVSLGVLMAGCIMALASTGVFHFLIW